MTRILTPLLVLAGCVAPSPPPPQPPANPPVLSWPARQPRTVAPFSLVEQSPGPRREPLLLHLELVRIWAVGAAGCPTAATRSDLQLSLGTEPPQSLLLHDFVGDLGNGEVVTAGASVRSPAPPRNAVFHLTAQADRVVGEVVGVRMSQSVVAVHSNTWILTPGSPCSPKLIASHFVGELQWSADHAYEVTTSMLGGAQETAEEVAARFPFCR